jgi:hypothetical protein
MRRPSKGLLPIVMRIGFVRYMIFLPILNITGLLVSVQEHMRRNASTFNVIFDHSFHCHNESYCLLSISVKGAAFILQTAGFIIEFVP